MLFSPGTSSGESSYLVRSSFMELITDPIVSNPKNIHKIVKEGRRNLTEGNSSLIRIEITGYDILSTPDGFKEFKNGISKSTGMRKDDLEDGLYEHQIASMSKHIVYETDESIVSVVVDIMDCMSIGKIDVSILYVLFLLVCASDSRQLLEYFFKWGKTVYELLSNKNANGGIVYDRLVSFISLLFDKSIVEIQRSLARLYIDKSTTVTHGDFELVMYDLIKQEYGNNQASELGRAYLYEYNLDTKSVRFTEVKKNKHLPTNSISTLASPLKCALI